MPRVPRTAPTVLPVAVAVIAALVAGAGPGRATNALSFGPPVRLTTSVSGGFEPGIVVDRYNNVYVIANKDGFFKSKLLGADPQTPTGVRGASYVWTSSDGVHFKQLTPDAAYVYPSAYEGDLDIDGDNNLYFVDTNVVDSNFARWRIAGPGKQRYSTTQPVIASGQLVDDRPWVAGGNDGTVLYTANGAAASLYPGGNRSAGNGTGPGRYSVYMSHDHGKTFDSRGVTLKDSGWCYPAADNRPGSKLLYVVCTDYELPDQTFDHALYSYVSTDNGKTWSRYLIAHYRKGALLGQYPTWPSVSVAPDGTVVASISDSHKGHGVPRVFISRDRGRSWTERDVPWTGTGIPYSWVDVAPDGTIGVGFYSQPDRKSPYYIYAAVSKPGGGFTIAKVSQKAIGTYQWGQADFFQVAFGPDNKLNVVWTEGLQGDQGNPGPEDSPPQIYYARQD